MPNWRRALLMAMVLGWVSGLWAADRGDPVLYSDTDTVDAPTLKRGGVDVLTVGSSPNDYSPVALATTGTITLSGEQTIDGTLTHLTDVLVWRQTDATQNGVYRSGSGSWTRRADADIGTEWTGNKRVFVTGGSRYAGSTFRVANTGTVTLGSTAISLIPDAPHWHVKPTQTVTTDTPQIDCNPPAGPFIGVILPVVAETGAVDPPAPQVLPGLQITQFCLLLGTDETLAVEIGDGNGVSLARGVVDVPSIVLKDRSSVLLRWDGTIWQQVDQAGLTGGGPTGGGGGLQASCDVECILRNLTEEHPYILAPAGQPGPEERLFSAGGDFIRARVQWDGTRAGPERTVIAPGTCLSITAELGTPAAEEPVGSLCNNGIGVARTGVLAAPDSWEVAFTPTPTVPSTTVQGALQDISRKAGGVYFFGCQYNGISTLRYLYGGNNTGDCTTGEAVATGNVLVSTRTGTLRNLYCNTGSGGPGADTMVFVARIEKADTAVTCTAGGGVSPRCSSASTAFAPITAGQEISISVDASAVETFGVICSVEVDN